MSKVNPASVNFLPLPPGIDCFSKTVTSHPALAKCDAADIPANPLPMTIAFFNVLK
jgi:hypothetical protein